MVVRIPPEEIFLHPLHRTTSSTISSPLLSITMVDITPPSSSATTPAGRASPPAPGMEIDSPTVPRSPLDSTEPNSPVQNEEQADAVAEDAAPSQVRSPADSEVENGPAVGGARAALTTARAPQGRHARHRDCRAVEQGCRDTIPTADRRTRRRLCPAAVEPCM